ncbi:MAG: P1 family peptidase [Candidatus Hodarchaeota archaeon]
MIDLRKLGWKCGKYKSGKDNAITDVPGVSVGHSTIITGEGELIPGKGPVRTGVTVIFPHDKNCFMEKTSAGVFVANGFGKATGIPQILETGVIETPIAITNTLNVGLVFDALVNHAISENPEIGIKTGSVSPIVTECFDGYLNDIQGRHVKEFHVLNAIKEAKKGISFGQGNIGAGTGMQVFKLKSGVGMASRQVPKVKKDSEKTYHVGALVVPNFGQFNDFLFYGMEMSSILDEKKYLPKHQDRTEVKLEGGSIIVVLATDLPLSSRQLNRISHRGALGITHTGSTLNHGSGDFIITFSSQNKVSHKNKNSFLEKTILNDNSPVMTDVFKIAVEVVQEAIYNAILSAETMVGRDNNVRIALDHSDLPEPP